MFNNIDDMRQLIIPLPTSISKDSYLLQLDILQGKDIDITSNLFNHDNYLLQLMFEVLHPQLLDFINLNPNNDNISDAIDVIRSSEVIYDAANFLSILKAINIDINELNSEDLSPFLSIWQSIWCNNLQWLAVANAPLPPGPLELYRFSDRAKRCAMDNR